MGEGLEVRAGVPPKVRPQVERLTSSLIRGVADAGMGRSDVLAFWFGEGDKPTPEFIREAAVESLRRGETYYSENLGRPYLRQALESYLERLHGVKIGYERLAMTSSGDNALMLASQLVVEPGDRVVMVTPLWQNVVEIPKILGAQVTTVPLEIVNGRWELPLERLLQALTPETRMVCINSPNNPTGWTIRREQQAAILEHCRRHGIWVLADDVYERLYFRAGATSAPSFLTLAEPDDRVMSINSCSKAWRMTGFRVGWMVLPPALVPQTMKLLEYNTSCIPEFNQRAAATALEHGEPSVAELRAEMTASRAVLLAGLGGLAGVQVPEAEGAMYAFLRVEGAHDSVGLAKDLVKEAGLGLAPGLAFGQEAEGWLRWCYAADPARLRRGVERLAGYLEKKKAVVAER